MISIIIPAYNEEKRIKNTLECYGQFFKKIKKEKKLDFEILIVINNTTDRTPLIVKKYSKKFPEIKSISFKECGKGFAIIEGFKEALKNKKNELIGFVDADLATPPEAFFELIKRMGSYDGAIASRWKKGSIIRTKQTILRRITSFGFNFLVRAILFLPYKDTQCGAKLFRREVLSHVVNDLGITKWAFDVDLLYKIKKKGFKIKEVPTIWEDKKDSKLNLKKVPVQMFSSIVRLRLLYSPLRFIARFYQKLPNKIKFH